ncbi:hypothetical protein [Halorarum salinum]|uniref:Uncharacterized protein n=1 Tax=Halorarum salinum TaxID=2743089 RepID=A0A7D5QD27_9EURY|nr:hypothetical protein [Halobaculum salinum]QLG63519.1 hypothetical protein HUG12_18020 [Halobaculum salinum]
MSQAENGDVRAENGDVPLWWILTFLLLALGLGAYAVTSSGGSLIA